MGNLTGFGIDPDKDASQSTFSTIPAGKYLAMIANSDVKTTKNGTGKRLEIEWQICDGNFKGRRIWQNLNILNDSEKAQQIGRGQLSQICKAMGVASPDDAGQLHNIPVTIRIKVREDEGFGERNEVIAVSGDKRSAAASSKSTATPRASAPWRKQAASPPKPVDDDIPY